MANKARYHQPKSEKIFLAFALIVCILCFIVWAYFLFQMPLTPAG